MLSTHRAHTSQFDLELPWHSYLSSVDGNDIPPSHLFPLCIIFDTSHATRMHFYFYQWVICDYGPSQINGACPSANPRRVKFSQQTAFGKEAVLLTCLT